MTTRPGTADGRAFGLSPYMPVGSIDANIMKANGISDATQYRTFIQTQGTQLVQAFSQSAENSMTPVDFGCAGVSTGFWSGSASRARN